VIKPLTKVREVGKLSKYPLEVAQLFGKEPELFEEAAELIATMGFDGIDINMGCPAGKVSEHGSGAGMIATPEVAQNVLKATRRGAGKLPVSVKTRLGVSDTHEMEEWIEALMEVKPVVISLHGRTLRQMYTGKADWKMIAKAAEIVHKRGGIILGNGDVKTKEEALEKVRQYKVDGVLIGRASFGNPMVFSDKSEPSFEQRLEWMVEHAKKYEETFGIEQFAPMRKHLAWYAKGFEGASELRKKLVITSSAKEVEEIVSKLSTI
ncbi:MAG: tRNA-dihydrouridine synthase, partial [bacterium]